MKLTTIADLKQLQEQKSALIEDAMKLGDWYEEFKAQDGKGGYCYPVEVAGSKERAGGIHASEVSRCFRLLVYSIANIERRIPEGESADPNMQMRFNLGHAVHAMLQNDFERLCLWLQEKSIFVAFRQEVSINPSLGGVAAEWDLHSSCDGEFRFYRDREAYERDEPYLRLGVEIKTKSGPEYEKLNKPDPDHSEQTCFYMAALDLPLMWLFYYNKSNSNFTKPTPPYLFQFNAALWDKLEMRFAKAVHLAEIGQLPAREEGRHCRWCPFSWTCQPPSLSRIGAAAAVASAPGAFRIPVVR